MQRIKNPLRGQETKVHQQLKKLYLKSIIQGEQEVITEIDNRKFRIDVFDTLNNRAFEIQRNNFGKGFYDKIEKLITQMRVVIVHPIVIKQKITRKKDGSVIGTSYINKSNRADFYSLFEKLVFFKTIFVPEKMGFDLLLIREHVRKEFAGLTKSNRPRYRMTQRELISIEKTLKIRKKSDFSTLFLPKELLNNEPFTNQDIVKRLEIQGGEKRKYRIAGWMTYSLCNLGLLSQVGKKGRAHLFEIPKQ